MKKGFILLLLSVLLWDFNSFAQVTILYQQNFETASGYRGTDSVRVEQGLYTSATKSIRLKPSKAATQYLYLDSVIVSPTMTDCFLEFNHIVKVSSDQLDGVAGTTVEYKIGRGVDPNLGWNKLTAARYDWTCRGPYGGMGINAIGGGFMTEIIYDVWEKDHNTTPTNSWWMKERFYVNDLIRSTLGQDTVYFRFVLPKYKTNVPNSDLRYGWLIDDIKISASTSEMFPPKITMAEYPIALSYPNSRDIRIKAYITDASGISSATLYYKIGAKPVQTVTMTNQSDSTYYGDIPFEGFDTLVHWHIEVKDNSINQNKNTFPYIAGTEMVFKSVRSPIWDSSLASTTGQSNIQHPLSTHFAYGKYQYTYDAKLLKSKGYEAGNISGMSFNIVSGPIGRTISGYTIKIANVDTNFTYIQPQFNSTIDFKTVYTSNVVIPPNPAWYYIPFNEVFKWNGESDIMIQICYINPTAAGAATTVKAFPLTNNEKRSIVVENNDNIDAVTSCESIIMGVGTTTVRPDVIFNMTSNIPLLYDAGVIALEEPTSPTQSTTTAPIKVRLKNWGNNTLNRVVIKYQVDGGAVQSFTWTGTLAGQATTVVQVGAQIFGPGVRKICAWTTDTVNTTIPDYEPYNNKICDSFVVCQGPLSGTKTLGGAGANYDNFANLFDALRYCGVSGDLTIQLAPGIYETQLNFPLIPGLEPIPTATANSITFVPANGNPASVKIRYTTPSIPQNFLVNFGMNNRIHFKKINFELDTAFVSTNMIDIQRTNDAITFDSCTFNILRGSLNAIVLGEGSNTELKNSSVKGGKYGVFLHGLGPSNLSTGNIIIGNTFEAQTTTAILVQNQTAVIIDSNVCNSVSPELSSYVVLIEDCYGASRITKNTIYSRNGSACMGLRAINGIGNNYAIVANNMLTLDGAGRYAMNVISGKKVKIVYNSLLSQSTNTSTPTSSAFSIISLDSSYIYNNIFTSEGAGVAANISYSMQTSKLNNNAYFSQTSILGKYQATVATSLQEWITALQQDSNSIYIRPNFLSSTDLRTYDRDLYQAGIAIAEVTNDKFGTPRPTATKPCIGAFEFLPPTINLALTGFSSPERTSCTYSTSERITVIVKNLGLDTVQSGDFNLSYRIGNGSPIANNETVYRKIAPLDTIHYTFIAPANLSSTPFARDTNLIVTAWSNHASDTTHRDDTVRGGFLSRYSLPALSQAPIHVNYGNTLSVTINSTDSIYWFTDSLSDIPFYKGHTLLTGPHEDDTTYYIAQKREHPILKITEIQFDRTAPGATYPLPGFPTWLVINPAIEISNLGDADVLLSNYQFRMATSSTADRRVMLPKVILRKNKSYVIQIGVGASLDTTATQIYSTAALINFAANTQKVLFSLYDSSARQTVDAMLINNAVSPIAFPASWTNANSFWTAGRSFLIPTGSPGVRRINTTSTDSTGWISGTVSNPMTMGAIEDNMMIYRDNECYGYKSPVNIIVDNRPNRKIDIVSANNITGNCGLGLTPITVTVKNTGIQPAVNIPLSYTINNGSPVYDTIRTTIPVRDTLSFTFSTLANFAVTTQETNFIVQIQINFPGNVSTDTVVTLDPIHSYLMPQLPVILSDTIPYGSQAVLNPNHAPSDSLVWYDLSGNLLDTSNSYTTARLYNDTALYVTSLSTRQIPIQIGYGTDTNVYNAYPTPYSCLHKYTKEQFLIRADEMQQMGYEKGIIGSLSFYVQRKQTANNMIFDTVAISLGGTSLTALPATWISGLTEVYNSKDTIKQSGWHKHVFDTPYYWDGEQNLVIQTCVTGNTANVGITYGVSVRNTTTTYASTVHRTNSFPVCATTAAGSIIAKRPNIQLTMQEFGCESDTVRANIVIDTNTIPNYDLDVVAVTSPIGMGNNAYTSYPITALVRNNARKPISGAKFKIVVNDTLTFSAIKNFVTPLQTGDTTTVSFATSGIFTFAPNEYCFKVIVNKDSLINGVGGYVPDDLIGNDTASACASFCFPNTTLTIGGSGANFPTFTEAINALVKAGICGPVVFNVNTGTYNEHIIIPKITGASAVNTITFKSTTGDSNSVMLSYLSTKQDSNYTVRFDGATNIRFEKMTIRSNSNRYARVLEILDSARDLTFSNCIFKTVGNIPTTGVPADSLYAVAVYIKGDVSNILFKQNRIDSSFISIYANSSKPLNYIENLTMERNEFNNFYSSALNLNNVKSTKILRNKMASEYPSIEKRAISISNSKEGFVIDKNIINLFKNTQPKTGIYIKGALASSVSQSIISNNMISLDGTSGVYNGLYIDSTKYTGIYYNTIRVKSTNSNSSLYVQRSVGPVEVKNNLLTNFSQGYVIYAPTSTDITKCDYNNYYTNATNRFAYWNGSNRNNFSMLQLANLDDANSDTSQVAFYAADDLRLLYPDVSDKAEYSADYMTDIFDTPRNPTSPKPCIGAYEYPLCPYDLALTALNPQLPVSPNVLCDGDSIQIQVTIKNYGTNAVTALDGAKIKVYISGDSARTVITVPILLTIYPKTEATFMLNRWFKIPFGMIGDTSLKASIEFTSDTCDIINNNKTISIRTRAALDLAFVSFVNIPDKCELRNVPIQVNIKNNGERSIPDTMPIVLWAKIQSMNANRLVSYPLRDTIYFPTPLLKGMTYTHTFRNSVNLYYDTLAANGFKATNVGINYKGIMDTLLLQYDFDKTNNTGTTNSFVTSYVTPNAPYNIAGDIVTIPYATWVTLNASHRNTSISGPIRWYIDTTQPAIASAASYTTPQLLTDQTYFLQCTSPSPASCKSPFGKVEVVLNAIPQYDAGILRVTEPTVNRVYMGNQTDTVRVEIKNYGTQTIQGFPVTYSNRRIAGNQELQRVTEICNASIPGNGTYIYTFDSLMYIDYMTMQKYKIIAWTDLINDFARLNDTILPGNVDTITPINENVYPISSANSSTSLEITNVSYGLLNSATPAIGYNYTKMFDVPMDTSLILYKGYSDTLYVKTGNPNETNYRDPTNIVEQTGYVKAYIDWNRNAIFEDSELVLHDTIEYSGDVAKAYLKIPDTVPNGFSRMRVVLKEGGSSGNVKPDEAYSLGETEDYLVLVRTPFSINAALEKVLEPNNFIEEIGSAYPPTDTVIRQRNVKVKIRNLGNIPLTSLEIKWRFDDDNIEHSHTWTGNIPSMGYDDTVNLGTHDFHYGRTGLDVWIESPNGGNDVFLKDNSLSAEFYRFKMDIAPYFNNFDSLNTFYNPIQTKKNRNIWEWGAPAKSGIDSAYTTPNAWVTDRVSFYPVGNKSIVYSSFFDADFRMPDTFSFYMKKRMGPGALMKVEYFNSSKEWIKIGSNADTLWYESEEGFAGTNARYTKYVYPLANINYRFGNQVQFRFVFVSKPNATQPNSGIAFDNLQMGLTRLTKDAGIIKIVSPTTVQYGDTIRPIVRIRNYGLDTLTSTPVSYTPVGGSQAFVARTDTCFDVIAPGAYVDFQISDALYINKVFTDSFNICATTMVPGDNYSFNDSLCSVVKVIPLQKDAGLEFFTTPAPTVVAGNMQMVGVTVHNYGVEPLSDLPISYVVGVNPPVTETAHFDIPIETGESRDYLFETQFQARFGVFKLMAYSDLPEDHFRENDTIFTQVRGVTEAKDISADFVVLDESDPNYIRMQLTFTNRGTYAIDSVTVGYFIDHDPSTMWTEVYNRMIPVGGQGSLAFTKRLPRRATPYNVCGMVYIPDDTERNNDTTCANRTATFDVVPVELLIEERAENSTSRIAMRITNVGNHVIKDTISLTVISDGEKFTQKYGGILNPKDTVQVLFTSQLPKAPTHTYDNVLSVASTARDLNKSNDTTNRWRIVHIIGIDDVQMEQDNDFWLAQNYPNPFENETNIKFEIPSKGNVLFFIYDMSGRVMFRDKRFYQAGKQTFKFTHNDLPAGIYYYGIEFKGKRLARKMIIK